MSYGSVEELQELEIKIGSQNNAHILTGARNLDFVSSLS